MKSKFFVGLFLIFTLTLIIQFVHRTDTENDTSSTPAYTKTAQLISSQAAPYPVEKSFPSSAKKISPISEQVDKLIATGKPADAYSAFILVQNCIDFEKLGTIPFFSFPNTRAMTEEEMDDEAEVCKNMTERMRTSRLDHLAFAAKNGVSGADVRFAELGPFGDRSALRHRSDDPLVVEWKKQAISQLSSNANNGVYGSLITLQKEFTVNSGITENNAYQALKYAAAIRKIDDHMGIFSIYSQDYLFQLQNKLSKVDAERAMQEANDIYESWLKNSKQ